MKAFLGDIVGLLAVLVVVEPSDDVRFSIDQPLELHEESSHVACFCVNLHAQLAVRISYLLDISVSAIVPFEIVRIEVASKIGTPLVCDEIIPPLRALDKTSAL